MGYNSTLEVAEYNFPLQIFKETLYSFLPVSDGFLLFTLADGIHGIVPSTNQLPHPVTKLFVLTCLHQIPLCCAASRVYVNR